MTSDEMIEFYKRVKRDHGEKGMTFDISIQPLLRSHPVQLDDFINKIADLLANEMVEKQPDQPRDEIRQIIYDGYRKMFRSSFDKE